MTSGPDAPAGAPKPSRSDELAVQRTVLAADRTLMAWVRTALSMISFGFTIYKFLNGLQQAATIHLRHPEEPRRLGLFLTGLGVVSVASGMFQHVRIMREMRDPTARLGMVFVIASAVVALGLLIFFGVLTRTGPF